MSGVPPCRRCVEQQLECVLTKSRRGGRRIKGVRNSIAQSASRDNEGHDPATATRDDDGSDYHSRQTSHSLPDQHPGGTDDMQGWLSSQQTGNWQADSHDEGGSTRELAESRTSSDGLEGHIATTDLLNPSDALDLLAQVADLDPSRQRDEATGQADSNNRLVHGMRQTVGRPAASYYPPLDDGVLTPSEASYLVKR